LLPQKWLERVLSFDAKSMGTVRRSAGIPYAICVILRSEWNAFSRRDNNMPLVSATMSRLLAALDTASLQEDENEQRGSSYYRVQVHHLNILRHIIRDSSLADQLRPYLETLLLISLKMWNHNEWSIRNSASLLFAAAMRKLDPSTTPTSSSGKHLPQLKLNKFDFVLFRSHFPALIEHARVVLSTASSGHAFSDLFPVLLILKKLHVSVPDPTSDFLCVPPFFCLLLVVLRLIFSSGSKSVFPCPHIAIR
jgi:hypothetical protein